MERKTLGDLGEQLALDHLKKKGYKLIETNYRCHSGEIDIVARQKRCLVFVEVRTKSTWDHGSPEESLTPIKQKHMKKCAYYYLQNLKKQPEDWRIDLVAIELDEFNKPVRIEILENPVEEQPFIK
jgi:putative endonuclease